MSPKDSLIYASKSVLSENPSDSVQLHHLLELGKLYQQVDADSSVFYLEIAVDNATKYDFRAELAKANHIMGVTYAIKGDYQLSTYYSRVAGDLYRKLGMIKKELSIRKNIGLNYWNTSQYDSALVVYNQLLFIADSIDYQSFKVPLFNNIGLIYQDLKQKDEALTNYYQGLELAKEYNDRKGLALLNNNISIILRWQGEYEESNKHILESIKIAREDEFNNQWVRGTSNLGANYVYMGKYKLAEQTLKQSLNLQERFNLRKTKIKTYWHLGELYVKMKRYQEAYDYTKRSHQLAIELKISEDILYAHKQYYEIYKNWNMPSKAYQFVDSIAYWKDSLARKSTNEILLDSQQKYKNKNLKHQLSSSQSKVQLLELKSKQTRLNYYIGLLMLAGILSLGYYFLRRKQFLKLIQKEEEVSELMIQQVEDYKQSIASSLHDDLGQSLAILKNSLQDSATEIELKYLEESIMKLRALSTSMYPAVLDLNGLENAISDMVKRLNQLNKTYFSSDINGLEVRLNVRKKLLVYRLIQEGFNNVLKHTNAKSAAVSYNTATGILLIRDNGQGISDKHIIGIGLRSMKINARLLDAQFVVNNKNGTSLQFILPQAVDRNESE